MKDRQTVLQMLFLILQIGVTMLVSIFLAGWVGYLLDGYFGTKFISIIGIVLGVLGGYRADYLLIKKFIAKDKKDDKGDKDREWVKKAFGESDETTKRG